MQQLGPIAKLLVLVGALNWGLVGIGYFFNQDLNVVRLLVGTWPIVEAVVYVLVGLSAVYMLVNSKK
ncbi:DUF378 domain-containing protein [Candidatus Peregrinibacteria bacterium CG10_big_fil_rev_8_21_14_0_10_55_24]|nr:MAG: DUF378 domain-containing protein [Candidatus Peregrinibacteria bacterium CG10_big_fil_rev_8_21_14_0_10_55_24]